MHLYAQIYEFAASAGSLEGYAMDKQSREELNFNVLHPWVENLVAAYQLLPKEVIDEIQIFCDQTFGRTIQSLTPLLGEEHAIIYSLRLMIAGGLLETEEK